MPGGVVVRMSSGVYSANVFISSVIKLSRCIAYAAAESIPIVIGPKAPSATSCKSRGVLEE